MKNTKKGFTLVEVLIVVVIIAILAALIVPRMLAQTEKAKAAEALQVVGAIKRAAERYYDFRGTSVLPQGNIQSNPGSGLVSGNWTDLGLSGIEKSKDWRYDYYGYATSFSLVAYRYSGGTNLNTYSLSFDSNVSLWYCGVYTSGVNKGFKPVQSGTYDGSSSSASSTTGCTI